MKTSGIHSALQVIIFFSRELFYIQVNFPPNTYTVQTAKNHKGRHFLNTRKLCHRRHVGVTKGEKPDI